MSKKNIYVIIAVSGIVLTIVAFSIVIYFFSNRLFSGYDVISEWKRKDSNTVQYISYNDNILKYSKDGASAFDSKGTVLWNGGYEMESPCADICGKYVVIYNVGGKELFVYNGDDSGTKLEMTLPIVKARVAAQGVVAVLLEDTDSNTINIYNPYSNTTPLLVEIPTNIKSNGYPMDFDISHDGNSLVASYLIVENGAATNQASFYNFTEVGQDKKQLVGGKSFGDNMIAQISFVNEDEVVIFHQTGFSLFTDMKQPKEKTKKTFEDKIESVVSNEKYVGVILSKVSDDNKSLQLFDYSGKKKLTFPITYNYEKVMLNNEEIIFSSEKKCNILRCNGKEKFEFVFDYNIICFLPLKGSEKYLLVDENMIQEIKLSGR